MLEQDLVESNFRVFFRKFDRIVSNREASSRWIRGNRERYNQYKKEYFRKHRWKWARKWEKENHERKNEPHRNFYNNHRTPENIKKNRELVRKWKEENPDKAIAQLVRHFKKYGKILGKPWEEFVYELGVWSTAVKDRDGQICQICENKVVHSHHIFYKEYYPELALNLSNGIPLCELHHRQAHGQKMFDPEDAYNRFSIDLVSLTNNS